MEKSTLWQAAQSSTAKGKETHGFHSMPLVEAVVAAHLEDFPVHTGIRSPQQSGPVPVKSEG